MPAKHLLFSFLLYFLFSTSLISQNTLTDSLIKESKKNSIHDSVKIKLFGDISWELMSSDINKSLEYARQELNLATQAKREGDIAQAESDIGNIYNRKSIFDSALIHYNKALDIRKKLNQDLKVASIYTNIATVYMRQSDFEEALAINFKSLKLFEKLKDETKQAIVLGNIGNLYYELKQNKLAEQFHRKSLKLAIKTDHTQTIGNALINIGTIKFESAVVNDRLTNIIDLDSALFYFTQAEKVLEKINNIYSLSSVYNNIGRIYIQKKEYSKAIINYEKALKSRELLEDKFGIGLSFINLAEAEQLTGNNGKSIEYLNKASEIFLSLRNFLHLKLTYGKLAEAYEFKKEYLTCLKYHQLYTQYQDSIYNENNASQMAEMQTKYDVEKKDLELAKNKAEIETEKNKRFITYGALVFFIIVCSIVIWAFIQKRKTGKLLENKNNLLENANHEISHQKEQLSEKQKEIVDSINYAKKIQTALLASEEMLLENSVNHFILFKPKDIVSGDFTWATKKDDLFYIACCDSTGHGVPGAFMSLLNIGFLSEAIKERNILKPGDIFNYVRDRLIETIGKDEQQDGFDGILLCIDLKNNLMTYAAANNAPVIIRNNELIQLSGNKMPVGKGIKTDSFDSFTLNYQKNDSLYLFTDGYPDQFGGPKGKKFKYKQLEDLLLKNESLSLDLQKEKLNITFEEWRGNLEQVDDVCIIGIKI